MTPIKPPQPTQPLSSEELAAEAAEAGVPADEMTRDVTDTHLPASESGSLTPADTGRLAVEQRIAELPPG